LWLQHLRLEFCTANSVLCRFFAILTISKAFLKRNILFYNWKVSKACNS
jgi:hypothetical protein